ncbi:MAG TPA: hypothetical protein VHU21_21775, partial [Paraburkholderia sp.]|nr:hypothetical protein [Paraburkholderia sp.]
MANAASSTGNDDWTKKSRTGGAGLKQQGAEETSTPCLEPTRTRGVRADISTLGTTDSGDRPSTAQAAMRVTPS